jgi:hypothetical protein
MIKGLSLRSFLRSVTHLMFRTSTIILKIIESFPIRMTVKGGSMISNLQSFIVTLTNLKKNGFSDDIVLHPLSFYSKSVGLC